MDGQPVLFVIVRWFHRYTRHLPPRRNKFNPFTI